MKTHFRDVKRLPHGELSMTIPCGSPYANLTRDSTKDKNLVDCVRCLTWILKQPVLANDTSTKPVTKNGNNDMTTESRREFEEWANNGYFLARQDHFPDLYRAIQTQRAWEAWQAARERQDKDSLRLQWLLDNHRGDFEIKELIAGNFDTYYVETTREAIDKAMNPPTSEKI